MRKLSVKIAFHIIAWAIFLAVPLLFLSQSDSPVSLFSGFVILPWIILVIFYYSNYYFFIPALLFKKKVFLYLLTLAGCFIMYVLLPDLIHILTNQPQLPFEHFPVKTFPPNFNNHNDLPFAPSPFFGMAMARMGSIVFFLLAFIISSSVSIINELYSTWSKQKEIEIEKTNAELAFLQSQVNPHFLFNTLYSIYSLALKKSDKAPEAIIKLSDMMRFVLTETQSNSISIEKEIDYIRKYIEFQELRISEKTKVNFEVNGNYLNKQIAPLLLVPFVENAFKYGVSSHQSTSIDIVLNLSKSSIAFMVANNKFEIIDENEKNHIGIENVKKRLQLLYANNHTLEIKETDDRFVISLTLSQL